MSVATSELSPGLRLVISRRRRGLTQPQEAKRRKVTLYKYRGWEEDIGEGVPDEAVGRLAVHEQCYVRRISRGVSLADQAEIMGLSRWWLRQMEAGKANVERLRKHWRI